jgi:hypothetical protein
MNYFAFGNQLNLDKFKLEYDFKFSQEQLDRKGIVSGFTEHIDIKTAQHVRYVSHWARVDVPLSDKVNLFFVGMLDDVFWKKPQESSHTKLRRAWGYIPGLEVYPIKNFNLKVFGAFIGRIYKYTDDAKRNLGQADTDNYRISVGVISPLVIL